MPATPSIIAAAARPSKPAAPLKPAYPWFGGKGRIAPAVWSALGPIDNLVIPFLGSAAELLACPDKIFARLRHVLVNDLDGHVANFWRAVREDPSGLARLCAMPMHEAEIEARHKWLCDASRKEAFAQSVRDNPEFFDVQAAAYWCYGLCAWFGGGWCSGTWHGRGDPRNRGSGINTTSGKMPHITSSMGVFRRRISEPDELLAYFMQLQRRFAGVKILAGDWSRALRHDPLFPRGITGVILDPPYSHQAGRSRVYRRDDFDVALVVHRWAVDHGSSPSLRIALCGYDGEHRLPSTWSTIAWTTPGGYAQFHARASAGDAPTRGLANRTRERVWLSPACLPVDPALLPTGASVIAAPAHARSPRRHSAVDRTLIDRQRPISGRRTRTKRGPSA